MDGLLRWLAWGMGIFGAICLLLYLLVFDTWVVTSDPQIAASVLPGLFPQDRILLRRGSVPVYGELVRCDHPLNPNQWVIGRVFGTGRDHVEVTDANIATNGKGLAARHGCQAMTVKHPVTEAMVEMGCGEAETGSWSFQYLTPRSEGISGGTHSMVVPEGKAYLVSDNRLMHNDSRDYGPVDAATCLHIVYRLWGETFTDSSRRFTILW